MDSKVWHSKHCRLWQRPTIRSSAMEWADEGSTRIWTTAYHPIANGIMERFYCQLMAAIKCQPHPDHWVPWVLGLLWMKTSNALRQSWSMAPHSGCLESLSYLLNQIPPQTQQTSWHDSETMSQVKPTPVRNQNQCPVHLMFLSEGTLWRPLFKHRMMNLQGTWETTKVLHAENEGQEGHCICGLPKTCLPEINSHTWTAWRYNSTYKSTHH